MSTNFNKGLSEEIQTDMLNCQGLMESIMTNSRGEFKLFVRNGSLQKAWPVPRKSVTGFNESDEEGIRFSVYKDLVASLVTTLNLQEAPFQFGYIIVNYEANEAGDELTKLQVLFQDEIHFAREKRRR